MLKISDVQTIRRWTVHGDDRFDDVFYPIPEAPRFRTDERGVPVFKFLKYRTPIDREDGRVGGGFAFFDTEFTFTPAERATILDALQEQVDRTAGSPGFRASTGGTPTAKIGTIAYTRGTTHLLLSENDGTLIEAVKSAGKPSSFGRNISAYMVEFTPEGATLFEQALQGQGGVVQVVYDLDFVVKLPELRARAWFESEKFYSFEQTIDIDWSFWGDDEYEDTITEEFVDAEAMGVELHLDAVLPDPEEDRKLKDRIRSNMQRALEDAVLRKMVPDIDAVPTDARGMPEDIEYLTREFETNRVSSFQQHYRENTAITWNLAPQGTLPNITTMVDVEGAPIRWADHATLVDLDDPFFKKLNVKVGVNADFEALPVHSVEVKLEYESGDEHELREFSFKSPDEVATFETFIENDVRDYTYSYQVNYVGSSRVFTSEPVVTNDEILTVNVDDIGLLAVDVGVGDIDFDAVDSAQVTVKYEDVGVETFEEQFVLTAAAPAHEIRHVLFEPRRRPIQYRVDYFMKDGRKIVVDWDGTNRNPVLVNDPLGRTRNFEVRAVGDLASRIAEIAVDLVYTDVPNDYTVEKSIVLKQGEESRSEPYAVFGEGGGVVTYSGHIVYRDGTVSEIPPTNADGAIVVGDVAASKLTVAVIPDLVDWTRVRLARVALRHGEGADETAADLIFNPQANVTRPWEVPLAAGEDRSYRWQATYFFTDGTQHTTPLATATDPSIVLDPPLPAVSPVTPVTPVTEPVTQPVGGATSPVTPVTPVAPVTEPIGGATSPVTPVGPVTPVSPVTPVTPVAPVTPVTPVTEPAGGTAPPVTEPVTEPAGGTAAPGGSAPPPPVPGVSAPPPPVPGGSAPPPPA